MKIRKLMSFDERLATARRQILPEEPVGYVFSDDQTLVGAFRVRAITATELGLGSEVSEFLTVLQKGDR